MGIQVCKNEDWGNDEFQKQAEVAKRTMQWGWLIIDDISMVSTQLLAEIDCKLRSVVRDVVATKTASDKHASSFGGLNVLLVGDFWQLEPPQRGCLASLPVEYIAKARHFKAIPTTAHGRGLRGQPPEATSPPARSSAPCPPPPRRCGGVPPARTGGWSRRTPTSSPTSSGRSRTEAC